jgi:hypothetical protein
MRPTARTQTSPDGEVRLHQRLARHGARRAVRRLPHRPRKHGVRYTARTPDRACLRDPRFSSAPHARLHVVPVSSVHAVWHPFAFIGSQQTRTHPPSSPAVAHATPPSAAPQHVSSVARTVRVGCSPRNSESFSSRLCKVTSSTTKLVENPTMGNPVERQGAALDGFKVCPIPPVLASHGHVVRRRCAADAANPARRRRGRRRLQGHGRADPAG